MIGAFWNIRSLNKSGRVECLKDFIDTNKLDFVGLQETKIAHFHDSFFDSININFTWKYLLAEGTAGGILVGVRNNKFDLVNWELKNFCISMLVKNTEDSFVWKLIVVYGSPYEHGKQEFIMNYTLL